MRCGASFWRRTRGWFLLTDLDVYAVICVGRTRAPEGRERTPALENIAWRRGRRHRGGVHSKYTIPLKQGGHGGGGEIAGQRRRDKKRKGRKSEGGRVRVLQEKKGKNVILGIEMLRRSHGRRPVKLSPDANEIERNAEACADAARGLDAESYNKTDGIIFNHAMRANETLNCYLNSLIFCMNFYTAV